MSTNGAAQHDCHQWRREVRRILPRADADVVEEIAQHVGDRWIRARNEGLTEPEADEIARRELHAWAHVPMPERTRRGRMQWLWTGWLGDLRYAARALRLSPLFTLASIVVTALAIVGNVAAFAIVYGVLGRPLPYPDSGRLAVIWQMRDGVQEQVSYPDYQDLKDASVFEAAAAMMGGRGSLRIGGSIERVNLLDLEAGGYALLGAKPHLGRLLNVDDSGRANLMVSHRLWRTHLASDPHIVGRIVWLSGREYTVVGVMAPGFDFELPISVGMRLENHDLWSVLDKTSPFISRRDVSTYEALVKLAPGVTVPEAQAAVDAIGQRLAATERATNRDRAFRVAALEEEIVGPSRRPLILACAAAMVALLVALANLITLAMLRMSAREAEIAVRQALGAGAYRVRREILTENGLVAAAGAVAGTIGANYLVHALLANEALHLPRVEAIRMDGMVLTFAALLAAGITLVLTFLPVRSQGGAAVLRAGARVAGRSMWRIRHVAVAAELALAIALSVGGALLALSVFRLTSQDPGFSATGVAAVRVSAYAVRYPTMQDVHTFFTTVIGRVETLHGVAQAAAASSLPLSGQTSGTSVQAEGHPVLPGSRQSAGWQFVSPGYLGTLGMPIRRGRDFTAADLLHGGHVTIINEQLARALFGDSDPIGHRIAVGGGDATRDWHEVIGVVADVRHHSLDVPPMARVYDLFGEHWGRTLFVVARARTGDAGPLIGAIRKTVAGLDPEAPAFESATMEALVARSAGPRRLAAGLAAALGSVAVLLALVGVAAAAGAAVAERTREIGIRAALGAAPRELLRLVLRDSTRTVTAGAVAGVLGSAAGAKLLSAQLYDVRAADVTLIIPIVAIVLLCVAVLSTLPAARRAASVDPAAVARESADPLSRTS